MISPPRLVVVGGVRHALPYVRELRAGGQFEVVGVTDTDDAPDWARSDAAAVARETEVDLIPSLDDPRARSADAALICTEPTRHAATAGATLRAGLATIIDKPIATDERQLEALLATAADAGHLCTGLTRVAHPAHRRAREWVDKGFIGWPISGHSVFLSNGTQFDVAVERPELVVDRALSGGGEVMNFLGYPIDSLRSITGCEPVEVFARSASALFEAHRRTGVEDIAVMSVLFTNGFVASITVGRVPATPSSTPIHSTLTVMGTHGHLRLADDQPTIGLSRRDGEQLQFRAGGEAGEVARAAFFADVAAALRSDAELSYGLLDAAAAVRATAAAYRSLESGQPVPVSSGGPGR